MNYLKREVEQSLDGFTEIDEDDSDLVEARSYIIDAEARIEEDDLVEAIDFIIQAAEIAGKLHGRDFEEKDEDEDGDDDLFPDPTSSINE